MPFEVSTFLYLILIQANDKQAQADQLQYELGVTKRRNEAEIMSLQQRIKALEIQVVEARKEADEYHKANVECQGEATALSNQVWNSIIYWYSSVQ